MDKALNFLVSTADAALFYNGVLACTAKANLNTSIEVSMQENNLNAGKGNKLIFSYKYGRELNVTLEAAEWKLEYLACNVGTEITSGLADAYKIGECLTIKNGVGTLPVEPVGDVAVETDNGVVFTVKPSANTIDLNGKNIKNGTVKVTYKYSDNAKSLVIDAESAPKIFKLVLDADRFNNKKGKVGHVQIEIPSYQPSGNFTMNFTPDGIASTNIDGKSLAVDGDTCESGNAVYAYVREFTDESTAIPVADIAATPSIITLRAQESKELTVIGLRGALYSSVVLDNKECKFTPRESQYATAENGVVKAVAQGTTVVEVEYNGIKDVVEVTVTE